MKILTVVNRLRMRTTRSARSGMIAAFLGALAPTPGKAQGIRVIADTITNNAMSDQVYFTVGGTSTFQLRIAIPRILAPGQIYWSMNPGTTIRGITLYEVFLGKGRDALLAVVASAHHDHNCDLMCQLSGGQP